MPCVWFPAESLDKVEVITNPRRDMMLRAAAELLILFLKRKESGMNGIFTVTAGFPETETATANINYKKKIQSFYFSGFQKQYQSGSFFNESQFLIVSPEIHALYH
ncbi:MAG: hypothetical protein IPI53_10275 [Saprospiraceae bacterium]|nr:hypothetical protein [Saprospiraceae bacterium]